MEKKFVLLLVVWVILFSSSLVCAQSAAVDPTFNPIPSNPLPMDTNFRQIVQPDGKVIVFGAPAMFVNGELRNGIFRLNADGSTDTTFAYNGEGAISISSVLVAPDGKIILAGGTSPNHAKMIRLNPNGSIDNSFSVFIGAVGPPEFTGNYLTVNAVQSDGKVIATHTSWGNIQGTWFSYSMRRYNLDGSVDSTFNPPALEGGHLMSTSVLIEMLPDGRFYLGLTSRSHLGGFLNVSRRLADGSADPTYVPFAATIFPSSFLSIGDMSLATDGGVLITGYLVPTAIGFPPQQQLRKFLPDGSPAPGFASPLVMSGGVVHQLPDGKILYSASGGTVSSALIRLESNGSVDNTYTLDPAITSFRNAWVVGPMNRPVFLGTTGAGPRLIRLLENGGIDPSFNVVLGSPGTTSLVAVHPDGKVVVAGSFAAMNGTPRNKFARLNADGSVDTTFDPGSGFSDLPIELLALSDGKVLAMGGFDTYKGAPVPRIIRLNSDGSLDGTFNAGITANAVVSAAIQADGKVLVAGTFTAVNGTARTGIARLNSDGALDETFNPILGWPSGGIVSSVVAEPDGKVTFAGRFTLSMVGQTPRTNLARVDSSGAMDITFDGLGVPQSNRVYRQPDGRYVSLDGNGGSNSMMRRNSNGTPDATFVAPIFSIPNGTPALLSLLLRPDGSMLVGGNFSKVGVTPRSNLVRLLSYGALDPFFLPTGPNAAVRGIAASQTGKVIIAGDFNTVENIARPGIARLNVPEFRRNAQFDFNGDGRSDFVVYRPSNNVWYELWSSNYEYEATIFGLAGDIPVPADFDGDAKTDEAMWRPSTGDWWYQSSISGSHVAGHYGAAGDIPRPSDFDGDGKADFIIFRPSNSVWYRTGSAIGEVAPFAFGVAGDQPLVGDFDGDGKSDMAIFRPSTGDWWYAASGSGNQFRAVHWGANGDIPVPADYDGDGKTDNAVFRPSNGGWYVLKSSDLSYIIIGFGLNGDRPVSADYDGDGKDDIAVFRPSTGVWYLYQSTAGAAQLQWGIGTDTAIPNALLP